MIEIKQLRDVYQFAGFIPRSSVKPHQHDSNALVIPLRRLKKMPFAGSVKSRFLNAMIFVHGWFVTSLVPITKSSLMSPCGESTVRGVA
jgi:hypothetical protein